jgi:hypothetical protein
MKSGLLRIETGGGRDGCGSVRKLLQALGCGIVADKIFKYCENVLPVLNHTFQDRTELRLAFRFAIPLGENGCGDADVAAKLVGRVTAEKEAVKKRGFTLRELKVLQSLFERVGRSGHVRNRSLQISASASRGCGA